MARNLGWLRKREAPVGSSGFPLSRMCPECAAGSVWLPGNRSNKRKCSHILHNQHLLEADVIQGPLWCWYARRHLQHYFPDEKLFTHLQNTNTLYVHISCARLQEENPQLPAITCPGDWGKLEVNRRTVVPVGALHTWVTGSASDLALVLVWLPVCLDGPSSEGAVVHSGLGAASLSRVMERSGQTGLSLPS